MRIYRWSAALALMAAQALGAQQLQGTVRDALSRQPVSGAVVSVLDATGAAIARDLTNSVGRYSVPLSPSAARIRVVRIGFHPAERAASDLARAGGQDFSLQPLPSLLEKVTVSEGERCPVRDDHEQALGLWEQARAGLLASVAARDARPGFMHTITYRRLYDHDGEQLVWQELRSDSALTSRPYVPIQPAAAFAARGYQIPGPLGSELGAPDADILLDDSFAATHCFSIARGDSAHRGEVGLAFEPAPGRDRLVDVRGVLWIDRAQPAVRLLEFFYTGLPSLEMRSSPGGTIAFRAMPNGVVFIDAWSITSPEYSTPSYASRRATFDGPSKTKISGGQVTSADWSDGTHWERPLASVHGHVTPARGMDAAGARVWLVGTSDTVTADSVGAFAFHDLLPGRYAIEAAEPAFASAGISQNMMLDSATASSADTLVALAGLDSAVRVVRALCEKPTGALPATLMIVHVVEPEGWDVPEDSVTVTWPRPSSHILGIPIPHEARFRAPTDHDGRMLVCNPPREQLLTIRVGNERAPQATRYVTLPKANPIALVLIQLAGPGGPSR